MANYKRNGIYHLDAVVNGVRYRESLKTTDWREANRLERERIAQLEKRAPDPNKRAKTYGSMSIETAIEAYILDRRAQVSKRMLSYWREQARPLSMFFKTLKLKTITSAHLTEYQNYRLDQGRAPKTINGELSVLRQLLKHSRLWFRFVEDYKPVLNDKPPVGRAATEEELNLLVATAESRPDWRYAYTATILGAYCGLRACEIKGCAGGC
jgi:hypothetical protein